MVIITPSNVVHMHAQKGPLYNLQNQLFLFIACARARLENAFVCFLVARFTVPRIISVHVPCVYVRVNKSRAYACANCMGLNEFLCINI